MKRFLAIYMGTAYARSSSQWDKLDANKRQALEAQGMKAWMEWGAAMRRPSSIKEAPWERPSARPNRESPISRTA